MHPLLKRQLRRFLADNIPPELQPFLDAVSQSYQQADTDRQMLERSLDLTSEELQIAQVSMRAVFAQLVNSSADGIFAFDRNYRFTVWNPSMEEISGLRVLQVIGKPIFAIFPSLHETGEAALLDDALAGCAQVVEANTSFIAAKHAERSFESYFSPLRSDDGAIIGGLAMVRDVTERHRVERELQRQLRETQLLNRVIAAATSAREPVFILTRVCEELAQWLDLPQAACTLINAERTHLEVVAEYCAAGRPSALGVYIPLKDNLASQYVITQCKPLVLKNAQTDPRSVSFHKLGQQRGTVSLLIVPLVIRDIVVGTIGLDALDHRAFSDVEIALAQNVAAAVSQALERAQLYAEVQQELAERRKTEAELVRAKEAAEDPTGRNPLFSPQ